MARLNVKVVTALLHISAVTATKTAEISVMRRTVLPGILTAVSALKASSNARTASVLIMMINVMVSMIVEMGLTKIHTCAVSKHHLSSPIIILNIARFHGSQQFFNKQVQIIVNYNILGN